jgi:hypothetical protein
VKPKRELPLFLSQLRDQALSPARQEVDVANIAMILWYLNHLLKGA